MTELEQRKAELEALAEAELKERTEGYLAEYDKLNEKWKMQLVPHRLETPAGVEWKQVATSTE